MNVGGSAVVGDGFDVALLLVGNGCGDQVDHTAGGLRAIAQERGTLEYFQRGHALQRREIIGGRIGVGRRRDQNAIFHQCDIAAALGGGTANANVRAQALTFLFPYIHARDGFQYLADVGLNLGFQLLIANHIA